MQIPHNFLFLLCLKHLTLYFEVDKARGSLFLYDLFLYSAFLAAFRYQKTQYNVFEVNQTGYDNCTTEGALGNWSSGKDFIPLNESKRYYFICGNGQCFNGMKVSVLVHPLPLPAASPVA